MKQQKKLNPIIQEHLSNDRTRLCDIYNSAKSSASGFSPTDLTLDEFTLQTEGEKIFVAPIHGNIAGFVSIWEPENFIHHLFVSPGYQSQGIGKALLNLCKNNYGRPLRLKCVIANTRACAFYEKNGWIAQSTGLGSDGEYINYFMES